jgi:hypothetical protein
MARSVFFSFHYQRDIFRVQQVKQHYITKGSYIENGFFDGSLEEKSKRDGDDAVKRMINEGLKGSSVLCVLIGAETANRRWVRYEIFKAIETGMGVFGILIHNLKDPKAGADVAGNNPFACMGYGLSANGGLVPMTHFATGWKNAPFLGEIAASSAAYLKGEDKPMLSKLFPVYDWVQADGFNNFGKWVESAALQANR